MPTNADAIRVNLNAVVNAADIRREDHNGREHLVIPSYTLPADVIMNRGLYPADEIDRSFATLENTLAPLGHPQVNGKFVSARAPEAINAYHVGAFNRNVEKRGNRVYLEKWVDVETARQSEGGRKLLAAVEAGEPVHTSTGVFLQQEPAEADAYDWIARNMQFDHDAILIGEVGAATPEQGVGMMVNVAQAVPTGGSILSPDNSAVRWDALSLAVRERFGTPDAWVCVEVFDLERVVFSTPAGQFYVAYTFADGVATLDGEAVPVKAQTAYFARDGVVNKFLQWVRNALSSKSSDDPQPSEAQEMTPEEQQAALDAHMDKVTQAVNAALAPVTERLSGLEATLAANADEALADEALAAKRTEAAKALGVEAETLQGMTANQLDAVIAKNTPAAPLLGGLPIVNAGDLSDYDKPVA